MINWLIAVSIRNRVLIIAVFVLVAGWGYWALVLDRPEVDLWLKDPGFENHIWKLDCR